MSVPADLFTAPPSTLPPLGRGPILVASDGAPESNDALFGAARLVGAALGVPIEVIGVCEPITGVAGGMDVLPVPVELDESRRQTMLSDLRRSVSIAASGDPQWPIRVTVGSPSRTLASEATARDASVMVMGIGRRNPLDRLFGTETTLATLRESRVPVLAVGTNFPATPTHAVVGLDFSAASVRAAQLALQMLSAGGRLTLVHVRPRFEHPSSDWQTWDAEYGRTLPPLFEQVRRTLDAPDGVLVETVTVRGDPAPALLAFAQQARADLVAVGTQRHTLLERLIVGSVATRILRTARCGVLAVPQV
jgi:nucleotide-binding universal stress UspA family protein